MARCYGAGVAVLLIFVQYVSSGCFPGLKTPGYTVPSGDILIEYGNSLDIYCILYDDYVKAHGPNASANLTFVQNDVNLPPEMVEIINSSTVRLHIEKPPKSRTIYQCQLSKEMPVCLNTVFAGTKPQPVTDFGCVGQNYDNLTCSWTAPQNYIKTEYNLTYIFRGRSSRFSVCPHIQETKPKIENEPVKMSCFWNVSTDPQYRQAHSDYFFTLTASNKFGAQRLDTVFKHFEHVISGPPENLEWVNKTSDSVFLKWTIPISMQNFPEGLVHRVLYQCEYGPKVWKLGGFINRTRGKKEVYFNLTGLPYAHALCPIRVSMKSAVALPSDESMWSRNSSITIRTSSKIPSAPPETNVGSFEIVPTSGTDFDAYVYWQEIPDQIKNGPNFVYNIAVEDNPSLQPVELKNAYAKFKNLSPLRSYRFIIWSENDDGSSTEKSRVYIPKQSERVREPSGFTKIAFGDGKYELTWNSHKDDIFEIPVTNYTLFWCKHPKDRPYQCAGYLDWVEVPNNVTVYNKTVSETQVYQFAISANTERGSSGMLWAACTVIHNKNIGKLRNVWREKTGSTYIVLGWKLDCSDRVGSVEGFVIYYCPIVGGHDGQTANICISPQRNITVHGAAASHGNVTGLQPYVTYRLTVAVITKHDTYSQESDPVLGTTLETAPSEPLNVHTTKVTNSSIALRWSPPSVINGILRDYEIKYNEGPPQKIEDTSELHYVLENLTSFKTYNISIIACTVVCSPPSDVISVTTKMGYPGRISKPSLIFLNDSFIRVKWDQPKEPRGRNDYYEVQIKEKLPNENRSVPIFNITSTEYSIEDCGDDQTFNTFYFSVRAVNIVDGQQLKGPWSEELESYCRSPTKYLVFIILFIASFFIVGFFFALKKGCVHYKLMRDVSVKLPIGLDGTQVGLTESGKLRDEQDRTSSADEQLLLNKLNESRHTDSGHESVTSLESSTHISSGSDSGIDQPSKENSLRLRNVAGKGYSSYCVLGVDTASSDTPYVTAGPTQDITKIPSIPCDPSMATTPYEGLVKSVNPGYLPHKALEATGNAPAYVVAGNKPFAIPSEPAKTVNPERSLYVQVAEGVPGAMKLETPVASQEYTQDKGYVSIGDALPPKVSVETKGYVPHRQFDTKTLKED